MCIWPFILSVSKVTVFYTEIATGDCLQCNSPSDTLKVALYKNHTCDAVSIVEKCNIMYLLIVVCLQQLKQIWNLNIYI